jgi:hypothetical protein
MQVDPLVMTVDVEKKERKVYKRNGIYMCMKNNFINNVSFSPLGGR